VTKHLSLPLATQTLTWAVFEVVCVLMFVACWMLIQRRKARGVDPRRIAKNKQSLTGLALVGVIIAVRLATHTYN
jgi:hypothetical protein